MPYFIVTYFYERKNTQLHMEKEEMIMKKKMMIFEPSVISYV